MNPTVADWISVLNPPLIVAIRHCNTQGRWGWPACVTIFSQPPTRAIMSLLQSSKSWFALTQGSAL